MVTTHDVPPVWSDPGDLTDAARGEPEHVLHQAVPVGVESDQLLLDKLLAALGAQPRGHGAQAAAVVRAEIGDIRPSVNEAWPRCAKRVVNTTMHSTLTCRLPI